MNKELEIGHGNATPLPYGFGVAKPIYPIIPQRTKQNNKHLLLLYLFKKQVNSPHTIKRKKESSHGQNRT